MADRHTITLYNTLTRRKEPFSPLDPDHVRMYVCGPTVYDYAHIGNARPAIVFDVLFRLLRHVYGDQHVTYVRNITDVEDKISARAARDFPGEPLNDAIQRLTETTAAQYQADVRALGCLEPTVEPRATAHIAEMVEIIESLVARGHAYQAEGHVLFHVPSDPEYGGLARRSLDEMQAGARVEVAPYKKDAMDFVLWKPSGADEPGWESPFGRGRPGWHIECSAMARRYLGDVFDIHGGGIDLVFPHHENELAQTCCALGTKQMAQVWMHNGFLQVEGEKMSKSLGNFFTIHDLLESDVFGGRAWPGEVLRLAMLTTHYRQPIDWTLDGLEQAEKALDSWYRVLTDVPSDPIGSADTLAALQDDLNTPSAIASLHALRHEAAKGDAGAAASLRESARMLGLLAQEPAAWFARKATAADVDVDAIRVQISARAEARKSKDWAEADRIRDELAAAGIQLKDAKDPTTGELVTTWEVAR